MCQANKRFEVERVIPDGLAQDAQRIGKTDANFSSSTFPIKVFTQNAQGRGKFAGIFGIVGEFFGQFAKDFDSLSKCNLRIFSLAADLVDPSHRDVSNPSLKPDYRLVALLRTEAGKKAESGVRLPLL